MNRDDIIRMAREAGYGDAMADLHAFALERFAALVAAHEREACARVCEDTILTTTLADRDYNLGCLDCAKAIRARGEK